LGLENWSLWQRLNSFVQVILVELVTANDTLGYTPNQHKRNCLGHILEAKKDFVLTGKIGTQTLNL